MLGLPIDKLKYIVAYVTLFLNSQRQQAEKHMTIQIKFQTQNLLNRFGWVEFYGISTIVGYLMPNPVYTYISNIHDLQTHFVDSILNNLK